MLRRTLATATALALFAALAPAAASAAPCSKHSRAAAKHAKKARSYDRKAMSLRNDRSAAGQRKLARYRRLTRKHVRLQEKAGRRYRKCKSRAVRGSYRGKVDGRLPVSFRVTSNGKYLTNLRLEIRMDCTNGNSRRSRTAALVLNRKIKLGAAGEFRVATGPGRDPEYSVSGRVRDGRASGVARFSTGTQRSLDGERCRSSLERWTARR